MSLRPGDDGPSTRAVIVAVAAAAVVSAAAAVIVAVAVIAASAPDTSELQRAALEEIGVSPEVLELPFAQAVVDAVTERAVNRTVAETKPSLVVGGAAGLVAGATTATASGYFVAARWRYRLRQPFDVT